MNPIYEYISCGSIEEIKKHLEDNPNCLNNPRKLRHQTLNENIKTRITPLFYAAITGQSEVVKLLLEKGASPKLNPNDKEDLFTWICLCPDKKARKKVLDIIFTDENRPKIHPDLPLVYKKISAGSLNAEDIEELRNAKNSPYASSLSPYNAAVLTGTELPFYDVDASSVDFSTFRNMGPLELVTYRVVIQRLLDFKITESPKIHRALVTLQLHNRSLCETIPDVSMPTKKQLVNLAVRAGDLKMLKLLPQDLWSVPIDEAGGESASYTAAKNGKVHVLKFLNENDVQLNNACQKIIRGPATPVGIAAVKGNVEVLKFLNQVQPFEEDEVIGLLWSALLYHQNEAFNFFLQLKPFKNDGQFKEGLLLNIANSVILNGTTDMLKSLIKTNCFNEDELIEFARQTVGMGKIDKFLVLHQIYNPSLPRHTPKNDLNY